MVTLHVGPVVLRPVRTTPCCWHFNLGTSLFLLVGRCCHLRWGLQSSGHYIWMLRLHECIISILLHWQYVFHSPSVSFYYSINQYRTSRWKWQPVTGASTSIIVFSCLMMAAPSLMILSATSSDTRPSAMKCCFSTSCRGLPFASNTSLIVSLFAGGNSTAETKHNGTLDYSRYARPTCIHNCQSYGDKILGSKNWNSSLNEENQISRCTLDIDREWPSLSCQMVD